MARHRSSTGERSPLPRRAVVGTAGVVATLIVAVVAAGTVYARRDETNRTGAAGGCPTSIRVVTASSFAPVLTNLAPALATGDDCVHVEVETADGRAAPARVAQGKADVWIPDDASWAATAGKTKIAAKDTLGSGTVVATSPIFMVTDKATAARLDAGGGSWLALADLVTQAPGGAGSAAAPAPAPANQPDAPPVRLVVRDPSGSGDGLVAAGAVGEGVWLAKGMDASSLALANALPRTRTLTGSGPALPAAAGEVGLVPEHALLPALPEGASVRVGTDRTAVLRYTWLVPVAATQNRERAPAIQRLLAALRGPRADQALAAAGLRGPDTRPLPGVPVNALPELVAKPFDVLAPHHVDHVLATWYSDDRRASLLMVIDVSGSTAEPAPGAGQPIINIVKQGCHAVAKLLPDEARLGLWEFGSELAPPNDYRVVLPPAPLAAAHRTAWTGAVDSLAPRRTGTGLYDTILAAYTSARDSYQPDLPNHVFVFTDGRNEEDPDSITLDALTAGLAAARDPQRPVKLSMVAFGSKDDAQLLKNAVKPVEGYVGAPQNAEEVAAVFIHVAAGGLHGE